MAKLIVELSSESASICKSNGEALTGTALHDLQACNAPGDCEQACIDFIARHYIDWRIVKMIDGKYENVPASRIDKMKACELLYPDSEAYFSQEQVAKVYLIWHCAGQIES